MSFSSLNFLSLDDPPTLALDHVPTSHSLPHDFHWMSIFLSTPKKTQDSILSPAELEEANKFADSVLVDGDGESDTVSDPTSVQAVAAPMATDSGEGLPVAPSHVAVDGIVVERPKDLPNDPTSVQAVAAPTATASEEGLPVAPSRVAVDGIVVERPKDLPNDPTSVQAVAAPTAIDSGEGLPIAPSQVAVDGIVVERPKELPNDNWYVIEKTRKLGKSAGHKDKYYVQKSTGRKLRSLKRVRLFVETGSATIRKPRKKGRKENSQVSDDKSKGKHPVEEGENGKVECQMPATSVLP